MELLVEKNNETQVGIKYVTIHKDMFVVITRPGRKYLAAGSDFREDETRASHMIGQYLSSFLSLTGTHTHASCIARCCFSGESGLEQ